MQGLSVEVGGTVGVTQGLSVAVGGRVESRRGSV